MKERLLRDNHLALSKSVDIIRAAMVAVSGLTGRGGTIGSRASAVDCTGTELYRDSLAEAGR